MQRMLLRPVPSLQPRHPACSSLSSGGPPPREESPPGGFAPPGSVEAGVRRQRGVWAEQGPGSRADTSEYLTHFTRLLSDPPSLLLVRRLCVNGSEGRAIFIGHQS